MIKPVVPGKFNSKIFVSVVYKSYHMEFPYDMCGVEPNSGMSENIHK